MKDGREVNVYGPYSRAEAVKVGNEIAKPGVMSVEVVTATGAERDRLMKLAQGDAKPAGKTAANPAAKKTATKKTAAKKGPPSAKKTAAKKGPPSAKKTAAKKGPPSAKKTAAKKGPPSAQEDCRQEGPGRARRPPNPRDGPRLLEKSCPRRPGAPRGASAPATRS